VAKIVSVQSPYLRIPDDLGHPFRLISATDSDRFRPPILEQAGHLQVVTQGGKDAVNPKSNPYVALPGITNKPGGADAVSDHRYRAIT